MKYFLHKEENAGKGGMYHIERYDRFLIWANSKLKYSPAPFYQGCQMPVMSRPCGTHTGVSPMTLKGPQGRKVGR